MKAELQTPLMKMFAETKKSQSLLKLNSYLAGLRTIACDCEVENLGDACWDTTNSSSVVSVGASFCGNEANVMQEAVPRFRSSNLVQVVEDDVSLQLALMQQGFRSAMFLQEHMQEIYAPKVKQVAATCTSDQASSKIETMGPNIQNANGVTIGQVSTVY